MCTDERARAVGRWRWLTGPWIGLVALAGALPASAGEFVYTGSLQGATGSYALSEPTRSLYLFNGLAFTAGRWRISASLPFVAQSTPWVSYSGPGPVPVGDGHDAHHGGGSASGGSLIVEQGDEVGIGDALLRGEMLVLDARGVHPSLRLAGVAKVPLAHERDIGTGEWDYGGGLSLAQRYGSVHAFVDLTYWVLGDPPAVELRNPVAYSAALGRLLGGGRFGLLGSVSGYTRVLEAASAPAQVGLSCTYWLRPQRSITANLALGVTDSAPDLALSIGWRLGL